MKHGGKPPLVAALVGDQLLGLLGMPLAAISVEMIISGIDAHFLSLLAPG